MNPSGGVILLRFVKKGDRYFGRGSTDDKVQHSALLAAHYAKAKIPLNIQFVWEFEEEIGSPHFEEFLRRKSSDLKCDSIMVVDSIWISRKTPCICYGIRGNLTGSMTLETAKAGVHSGITGGVARNPITELCWVANQCYDVQRDRVLIPGFYDDVQQVSRKKRKTSLRLVFICKIGRAYGLTKTRVEKQ
jgi:acetylornithine deacetylase/succinyl-diaminopimelate desuccinylase-like protein